jgi:predicted transposase YdaD
MAQLFDATLKQLVEDYPDDWLAQLGMPPVGPVEVINADLSTVTAMADRIFHLRDPAPWLLHLELQASRDPFLARRVLQYNVLVHHRHGLLVHSVVVLLRPEADAMDLTGAVNYQAPYDGTKLEFRFDVLRLWLRPVDPILVGGLGTLPLAPLGDVAREALPGVIRRMEERLTREAGPAEAASLWTATYILMGLRYSPEVVSHLLQGVRAMKESATYQAILAEGRAEGRAEEAKRLLLHLGGKRFGPPSAQTRAALEGIDSVERLEQLTEYLLEVSGWDELLATGRPARRSRRRSGS